VSNAQLIKENGTLGRRFHQKSVAEQNSLNLCFYLLSSNDFANLRKDLFANDDDPMRFRQIVVNSVMATDIFDPDLKSLRNARWVAAFDPHTRENATMVIEHLIQASDVAHTMQHWMVYRCKKCTLLTNRASRKRIPRSIGPTVKLVSLIFTLFHWLRR
jgi:hypothetical protein